MLDQAFCTLNHLQAFVGANSYVIDFSFQLRLIRIHE